MHDKVSSLADVWRTCNKIRAAAFRVGLNLWDWYRPLDPDGNSLISESKFVSVLAGPLRAVVGLSDAEIAQLADYFKVQDGRVLYHQLCRLIHEEAEPGSRDRTAADCLLDERPPAQGPACRTLDEWETRRLCCLLATIAARDLPLKPYFQDYELVAKGDGRVTLAHFARVLARAGVLVAPADLDLLVRKFIKDSYTLDYVEFLAAVEAVKREGIRGLGPAYLNPKAVLDTTPPKLTRPEVAAGSSTASMGASEVFHPALQPPSPPRQLVDVMLRVQEFVMQRRIRVSEFFRDYDALNCGRVTPQQFRRALDAMGLGALLASAEFLCVIQHYLDPNDPQRVCWRTFEDDCDQVFTIKELEKHPEARPGAAAEAVAQLAPRGSAADRCGREEADDLDAAQEALLRLRAACRERALQLGPAFAEHDERSSGHVSRAQLRRVLARLGVLLAERQLRALDQRYLDDCGFGYARLLREMDERPADGAPGPATAAAAPAPRAAERPAPADIVHVLAKIKGKMVREGVRPRDFLRQFDPRRELVIPRADFYRGLAAAGLALAPAEMDTLMEVFGAPARRRLVEYERFCAAAGEALAQPALERAPLLRPVAHVPADDSPLNFLDFEERKRAAAALDELSRHPDRLSDMLDVFSGSDKRRCGTVPRAAADRALALLPARERALLCRCFGRRRGAELEVDYRALCKALELAQAAARAQRC